MSRDFEAVGSARRVGERTGRWIRSRSMEDRWAVRQRVGSAMTRERRGSSRGAWKFSASWRRNVLGEGFHRH